MTPPRATSPWWATCRRVAGSTVVLFVVILAFLVGRVRAGADPGLTRTATPVPQSAPPARSAPAPGVDPGSNGATDNFGNALPDGSGAAPDDGQGTQGFDPPSTHVS